MNPILEQKPSWVTMRKRLLKLIKTGVYVEQFLCRC
jgi:hypothetical protein